MTQASIRAERIITAMRPKTASLPCPSLGGRTMLTPDHNGWLSFGIVLGMLLAGVLLVWQTVVHPQHSD